MSTEEIDALLQANLWVANKRRSQNATPFSQGYCQVSFQFLQDDFSKSVVSANMSGQKIKSFLMLFSLH